MGDSSNNLHVVRRRAIIADFKYSFFIFIFDIAFYIEDYGFFFDYHDMTSPRIPRQGREPLKRECGNAWAFNKNGFLASKSRLFGRIDLCKIKHPREVEIDEPEDLISVGCLMKKL